MEGQVAIIGDGQMGLVMADALAERGLGVRLWGPFPEEVRELAASRRSPRLADLTLPASVRVTADEAEALDGATAVLSAIPTQFLRDVWQRVGAHAPRDAPILSVTKGIENDTLMRPSQVIERVLTDGASSGAVVCVLSGPTIAAELARRQPATLVAACHDPEIARLAQDLLTVPWLRIYRLDDPLGVELAAATKNIIALAAGMVDGLDAGDNAKSALLARGLAEIARLGTAMGARLDTFFGIAGVGDLATTCFSPSGRNRTCGERIARGESLEEILDSSLSVVEGVATTKSVVQLARSVDVEMPITTAVHAILFEGLDPRAAIRSLMSREPKAERVG
jgi:glycerol-3-phosphate dehydrogenase (NAD(P)+)